MNVCPVKGCQNEVIEGQSVCRSCWRRVPPPLRNLVFEAWRLNEVVPLAEALREALEWLREHPTACDAGQGIPNGTPQ